MTNKIVQNFATIFLKIGPVRPAKKFYFFKFWKNSRQISKELYFLHENNSLRRRTIWMPPSLASLTKIPLHIIPTTILQMLSFIFLIISDTCFWKEALNWSTLRHCVRGRSIINCWNKQCDLSKVRLLCALLFSFKEKLFHNSIWVVSLSFWISYEFSNIFKKILKHHLQNIIKQVCNLYLWGTCCYFPLTPPTLSHCKGKTQDPLGCMLSLLIGCMNFHF